MKKIKDIKYGNYSDSVKSEMMNSMANCFIQQQAPCNYSNINK